MNLLEKVKFGYPNQEQLNKINQLRPAGYSPYEAEQVFVVPIAGANNLIAYSGRCWTLRSLKRMVASYAQNSPSLLEDHGWDSKDNMGQVFDAELWSFPNPSQKLIDHALSFSPNVEEDTKILRNNGYHLAVLYAFVETSSEIASNLLYKRRNDVSVAGFALPKFYCPVCSSGSKLVSFADSDCPHLMPFGAYFKEILGKGEYEIAPYYLIDDWKQSVEVSVVNSGDCPQAQIFTESLIDVLLK